MNQKEVKTNDIGHDSQPSLPAIAPGEVIIGTVMEIDRQGHVLVDFHANPKQNPIAAVSILEVNHKHVGRQAALLFAEGDLARPVIMGLIHSPLQDMLETYEVTPHQETSTIEPQPVSAEVEDVTIDGKRIVLEGKEEIVLRCGEASITLTKAGKILIRGKYLLNRSEGVNRIMGGSVQVN